MLEQGTVDVLRETGVGARMDREGLLHHGTILKFAGEARRIDFQDLTGQAVMVYGQHEVVKDLVAARLEAGGEIVFEVSDTRIEGIDGREPTISWLKDGVRETLSCDFVACLLYTSPSPRDKRQSRMPSSA